MIVLGMFYTQALRALILEDLGIFASLARGWEVFVKNIGGLLAVAVILVLCQPDHWGHRCNPNFHCSIPSYDQFHSRQYQHLAALYSCGHIPFVVFADCMVSKRYFADIH